MSSDQEYRLEAVSPNNDQDVMQYIYKDPSCRDWGDRWTDLTGTMVLSRAHADQSTSNKSINRCAPLRSALGSLCHLQSHHPLPSQTFSVVPMENLLHTAEPYLKETADQTLEQVFVN